MEGFVLAFKEQINKHLEILENRILNGGCETFSDYKAVCGEIRGLNKSIIFLSETLKQTMEEDE